MSDALMAASNRMRSGSPDGSQQEAALMAKVCPRQSHRYVRFGPAVIIAHAFKAPILRACS